jgi:hypothetical protein
MRVGILFITRRKIMRRLTSLNQNIRSRHQQKRAQGATYMNTIQKIAVAICVAGAFQLQVSSTVEAQGAQDAAPAQSLLTVHPLLPGGVPEFSLSNIQSNIHILPTPNAFKLLRQYAPPLQSGSLLYHSGGSVMPSVRIYVIYRVPPSLQNGGATRLPAAYQAIETRLMKDYSAHGIDNNNTQYYQTVGSTTRCLRSGLCRHLPVPRLGLR